MNAQAHDLVEQLVCEQREGFSLQQAFYCDADLFRLDIDRVINHQWLLVDHVSRIPNPGDYFLFSIGQEEIIIVRQDEERTGAFFNVCRHRGSRVCVEPEGRKKLFTCPYHAWNYDLDGKLRAARLMPAEFDATKFRLNPCHIRVFQGFIFVNLLPDTPPAFDDCLSIFETIFQFHGFSRAKIAAKRNYPSGANWKLCVENFFECYHCVVAHPELCEARGMDSLSAVGSGPGSGAQDSVGDFAIQQQTFEARANDLGHPLIAFEEPDGSGYLRQIGRAPIKPGSMSETIDGKPASTLMGEFKEYDGGITMLTINPVSYVYASNDFGVMFRFTPRTPMSTDVELTWLVDEDAEEGRDYEVTNILRTLDPTLLQDKVLVENNQNGIRSQRYQPGRYSESEGMLMQFQNWYLKQLSGTA